MTAYSDQNHRSWKSPLFVSLSLISKLNWFPVTITQIIFKNSYFFWPPSDLPSDSLQSGHRWLHDVRLFVVSHKSENVGPRNNSILNASKLKGRYELSQAHTGYRFLYKNTAADFSYHPGQLKLIHHSFNFPNKIHIAYLLFGSVQPQSWNFHSVPEKAQSLSLIEYLSFSLQADSIMLSA